MHDFFNCYRISSFFSRFPWRKRVITNSSKKSSMRRRERMLTSNWPVRRILSIRNGSVWLFIYILAREPWPMNTNFFLPLKEQMVIWAPTCLATLCLLRKVRVPSLIVQHVRNAAEMSTNGKASSRSSLTSCLSSRLTIGVPPVITLNNRIFCEFEDVANLIELKVRCWWSRCHLYWLDCFLGFTSSGHCQ